MLLWDLSLAQPHLLHILHSARDTDCSLEKCLLQCWTSMCNIYHGGVRNFNLCFQNRLAAEVGSKQGVNFFFFHFFVWHCTLCFLLYLGGVWSLPRVVSRMSWWTGVARMPPVRVLLHFEDFLWVYHGNVHVTVNKCNSQGKDRAQDYAGCNNHSRADLFVSTKLWSLGPWHSMLGWAAVASGKKRQLCR